MGLPGVVTGLIGRRRETAEVRSRLGPGRVLTLVGPGGVGKTRLAVAVAGAVRDRAGETVFVGLAELRDGALLPTLVADRLGLQDRSGQPARRVVLDHLRDREAVLVLDNCEHVVEACAEFVAAVLAECPRVALLATSRQSLGVAGENLVRVAPLPVPADDVAWTPAALAQYDGIRLFTERATAVLPTFRITDANCADVVRVCRRLDGLPLAIELAATRIRSLSPKQLAERLTRRLPLLTTAPRTAPERQQTLRAAVGWSHELCSPAEQAVWARASVFAGSFDLDAAEEVCGGSDVPAAEVLDAIDGLVDKSVLIREGDQADVVRYRMLETLREYGQEQLERSGERTRVARLHRDWIDRLTAAADAEWVSSRQLAWIDRLRREHGNLRAALDWSLATPGEAGAALRIAGRLDEYWSLRGSSVEARTWLERALAAAGDDHPGRAHGLAVCALHALWHSDMAAADALLAEAEALGGDEVTRAHRTYVASLLALMRIEPVTPELAAAAIDVFRAHGEIRRELHPLFIHGTSIAYLGDLEAGRRSLRRMMELSEERGESYYRAMALFGITAVEVGYGDIEVADSAARDGLSIAALMHNRLGEAYRLESLAWVADARGEYERAATLFGIAATAWESVGATAEVAVALPHRRHAKSTRKALGADRFAAAFAEGRAMDAGRAMRFALGDAACPSAAVAEDELTKREREIAGFVAKGLSNRDIAAELVVSPRTVDAHVQHILTKLGFRNRAQIAAWVAGRR
ncbi:LuxR C-terminal-related transcriptional regulator [Amycolatopsis sp. NPDC059021]|uniref:helix-turn-helix transcriptional regulator n=1 Tax=Amycolatopsis sp. NPDC059021 TaxID=3346704 RepID=UPI00366F5BC9